MGILGQFRTALYLTLAVYSTDRTYVPLAYQKCQYEKKKKQQQQQQLVFVAQRSHQRKESYNINVRLMWIYMLNAERKECVAWRFER